MRNILLYLAALTTACFAQDAGYIENFRVVGIGPDFITLGWDFVEDDPEWPLNKYSLVTDSDLTSEFKCSDSSCTRTVDYLEICIEHTFDLTPIFSNSTGVYLEGEVASTTGYTEDAIPGPVSDIAVIADTDAGTTLTWSAPTVNAECVAYYDVCFRLEGETTQSCMTSDTTQVTIVGLSACGLYHVYVTPVTPSSNSLGAMYDVTFQTRDGVPGEPQDVVVGLITPETIQLLWNDPVENFLCVDKYLVTFEKVHATVVRSPLRPHVEGFDNEITLYPLDPCTNYSIDLSSANEAEETSERFLQNTTYI